MNSDRPLPISSHLMELRRRIIISFIAVLLCTFAVFPFAPKIFSLLASPMHRVLPAGAALVALTPFEGWFIYMKICLVCGIVLASPIWLGQILAFASPAVGKRAIRVSLLAGFAVGILFVAGAVFCFSSIIPFALRWGISLMNDMDIRFLPDAGEYISLVLALMLAFGMAFELPAALAIAIRLRILSPATARRGRPYVYVGAFIAAAILTPPDVATQIALAVPLILLFELGILAGRAITP